MPSTRKKSPTSAAKKKTLTSTKNKNSVKKPAKKNKSMAVNDGSYLQSQSIEGLSSQGAVSTAANVATSQHSNHEESVASTNQAILTMLQKLDASNQVLSKRMDDLERQGAVSSTPMALPTSQRPEGLHAVLHQQGRVSGSATQASSVITQGVPVVNSGMAGNAPTMLTALPQNAGRSSGNQGNEAKDAVAPKLEVMRSIPSISSAVSQLLGRYGDQADQEALPGKTYNMRKKSGVM